MASATLLGLFSAAIFGYFWWGRFQYYDGLALAAAYAAAGLLLAANHALFREGFKELGLRVDNLKAALRAAAGPTVLLAGAALALGAAQGRTGDLSLRLPWVYLPWALAQQYVLQDFIFLRFRSLLGEPRAAVAAAAGLFALFHLPNGALMAASFIGAVAWCWIFSRRPNLWAVALSHALLGLLVTLLFKFDGLGQLRVGPEGHPYSAWGDGVAVAAGYEADGRPLIAAVPGQDIDAHCRVRLFRPDGTPVGQWEAFQGVGYSCNIAMGDLGFGPGDEVALGPGPGVRAPSQVRIFDLAGEELRRIDLPGPGGYGAWVSISGGRLIAAPGPAPGREPRCHAFGSGGEPLRSWTFQGLGPANGIRAAHVPAQPPRLLLWPMPVSVNKAFVYVRRWDGRSESQWPALGTDHGLNVTPLRLPSGEWGVAAAPGPLQGHPPHIRLLRLDGVEAGTFFAEGRKGAGCGARLAALDLDGDGADEIVMGEGNCPGAPATVRIFRPDGQLLHRWQAFPGRGR